MEAARAGSDEQGEQGGVVIPFPSQRRTPPPLPPLPRAIPTPGMGSTSSLFNATLTRRYDREAA